jgi:hypothetical protein
MRISNTKVILTVRGTFVFLYYAKYITSTYVFEAWRHSKNIDILICLAEVYYQLKKEGKNDKKKSEK